MSMEHDEKGFFSAGWDGDAIVSHHWSILRFIRTNHRTPFPKQWDLNTGQIVRRFTAHGAQLAALAVRPVHAPSYSSMQGPTELVADESSSTLVGEASSTVPPLPFLYRDLQETANGLGDDSDAKSDNSFDPLFDDEPDAEGESATSPATQPTSNQQPSSLTNGAISNLAIPDGQPLVYSNGRGSTNTVVVPKNAPPLLDSSAYQSFSPDVLMTASIDGQVILWDRRVETPGNGVGRLWMSEKTPPWCLSVSPSMGNIHRH
jgi:transcriptional activator SPT8